MDKAKKMFEYLIQTIENNAVDNKATIANVELWAECWRKEMNIALNYAQSSSLLNNSFEIGDTVKYKLEICTIDFIDDKNKIAKLRPNFRNALIINVDLNNCTKIVL